MILLRKADIIAMHERAIQEFGGSSGIRDEGGLESAVVAADNRVWYEQADEVACAATYAFHLTMAHAFVDGNKRVAAAAMEAFLIANDLEVEANDDELHHVFLAIAAGEMARDALEQWLRPRVRSAAGQDRPS